MLICIFINCHRIVELAGDVCIVADRIAVLVKVFNRDGFRVSDIVQGDGTGVFDVSHRIRLLDYP